MKNKMPYQLVLLCYILHQTNLVPRPCNPRVILSEAAPPAKNHVRPPNIAAQSNPAPSGAPAGGISLAERYYIKHRTTPLSASRMAECVTRYVGTTEIPPAGAPSGGRGSLCGNVWLSRSPLNPVCRFAQDDTWVTGARYHICLV